MVRPIPLSVIGSTQLPDGLGMISPVPSRDGLRPKRKTATLTRFNGLALLLSLQVGAAIFSAPSLISQLVRSPAEGLAVFVAAGLLVWTGAASFVELGLLIPSNGGIQDYLRAAWGDYAGHLFSWVWLGVARPAGGAVVANIFADFLLKALYPAGVTGTWPSKIVALGCVASLTAINCLGATSGAKAASGFVVLKLTALASIIIIGLGTYMLGHGEGVPASPFGWFGHPVSSVESGGEDSLGDFSKAVLTALFCYGGWESVGFIVGDMENPVKDLPIVINGAMSLVMVGFFLMNASLYICLPFDVIRESRTVALDFANRTIGPFGGLAFSLVVAVSAMGAANASMFAISKLAVAASQRGYFPPILANLHCCTPRDEATYLDRAVPWPFRVPLLVVARLTRRLRWEHSVPVFALLLNWALTSTFILVGGFTGLITLIEIVKSFCFMMSILGIFKLRRRGTTPPLAGSHPVYRTWTGNPVIFASVSGLLIIRGVLSTPLQAPVFLLIGILGLAVLYGKHSPGTGYEPAPPV